MWWGSWKLEAWGMAGPGGENREHRVSGFAECARRTADSLVSFSFGWRVRMAGERWESMPGQGCGRITQYLTSPAVTRIQIRTQAGG